jgi:hypothetical protein
MGVLKFSALSLAASLLHGCSSGQPPAAPSAGAAPPDKTRKAVDSQEHGDGSP